MAYSSSVAFDAVVVIESLRSPDDLLTGAELFARTIRPGLERHNLYGELYQVRTAAEFRGALVAVRNHAGAGRAPILHLEAHGDELGIQLVSGETITWTELAPALAEVNRLSQVNLLVVAAACHGWFLGSVLRPVSRSPFWGVIGPPDRAGDTDLSNAMHRFYSELLINFDLTKALRAANLGAAYPEWRYRINSAEILFCKVFRYYMDDLRVGGTKEQRVARLVVEIARAKNLDALQTARLRVQLTEDLENHRFWYEFYKEHFLMLDLFPQNARRFLLGFDECAKGAV